MLLRCRSPVITTQTGGTHCGRGCGFWPVYEAWGRLSQVALLFNKRLGIGDLRAEQVDDCIQLAQIQTSWGLFQLINVYVVADWGRITLGSDSALRKIPGFHDGESESECVLLGNFNLHHPSGEASGCDALMRQPESSLI